MAKEIPLVTVEGTELTTSLYDVFSPCVVKTRLDSAWIFDLLRIRFSSSCVKAVLVGIGNNKQELCPLVETRTNRILWTLFPEILIPRNSSVFVFVRSERPCVASIQVRGSVDVDLRLNG